MRACPLFIGDEIKAKRMIYRISPAANFLVRLLWPARAWSSWLCVPTRRAATLVCMFCTSTPLLPVIAQVGKPFQFTRGFPCILPSQLCSPFSGETATEIFVGSVTSAVERSDVPRRMFSRSSALAGDYGEGCEPVLLSCKKRPPWNACEQSAAHPQTWDLFITHGGPRNPFFISPPPTPHVATAYVTATVRQTQIIPQRRDSNPPANPLKALETQVLQRRVSTRRAHSWATWSLSKSPPLCCHRKTRLAIDGRKETLWIRVFIW